MSMTDKRKQQAKPRLTLRIFLWGVVDVGGMALFSVGLVHFIHGPGSIFQRFPASTAEAVAAIAIGGGIMVFAAGNILRELSKQPHLMTQDDNRPAN